MANKTNVYFGGKCISHDLTFPDHTKKSVGVILPSAVTFSTDKPEIMEIVEGKCRVCIGEENNWTSYEGGMHFHVSGATRFDIIALNPVHYVRHFSDS